MLMNIMNTWNKIHKKALYPLSYNCFWVFFCISERIFPLFFFLWKQPNRRSFSPRVSLCIISTPSRFSVWICMTSPLSLCTGARPEICLSPKNIRIPAQEGRLGFSAAWADGQRAGGEERRGEDSRGVERRGERERLFFFLGRFPAAWFWSARLAPCSLGPVEQSTAETAL